LSGVVELSEALGLRSSNRTHKKQNTLKAFVGKKQVKTNFLPPRPGLKRKLVNIPASSRQSNA
jgi:hypothetical protein